MSPAPSPTAVEAALGARLRAVATALGLPADADPPQQLAALVERVAAGSARDAWLAYTAIAATFPDRNALAAFRRAVELAPSSERVAAALAVSVDDIGRPGRATRGLELVDDPETVLVDVSFSASNDHNTGVQRVVRSFVPHWVASGRPVRLVRWSPFGGAYVDLDDRERARILAWRSGVPTTVADRAAERAERPIVVPWGARVFHPEVLQQAECAAAACLAEYSGAKVGVLGHDTIPVSSADSQPELESERFAKFLDVVKHADFVAGVSRSAADEFAGFATALSAQGLRGPRIVAVPNAVEVPAEARAAVAGEGAGDELPIVLCVGSHEPRKNQEAVLAAAEQLFAEGVRFRMVFVGGGGRQQTASFDAKVARWRTRGMAVESHRRLSDPELWSLYRRARFTVLLSLHEGFGLPVAESVSLGTPVLTSDFGSLAEVAAAGGCVTIDPRSDVQIVDAMRRMLADDELIARLRAEAAAAPERTWAQFADELWQQFTADEQETAK
ncbi:hypothetical protein GCM10022288_13420 [Gryllotalpicola kribbensis]|uniref:Glycosyl transferase family 1 domain-containing protein n=1 Tax=Gryllotalpicola kribbensis TaxID=993084 RepID=A0ABP8AQ64_9MICO